MSHGHVNYSEETAGLNCQQDEFVRIRAVKLIFCSWFLHIPMMERLRFKAHLHIFLGSHSNKEPCERQNRRTEDLVLLFIC
ncbi:unnamed protein product [Citrullus colocynthis]|uniref:Uncharacterized protein n=1 Tax=Citrullus colocynthis TaxID=252529 RepID=A0ABP0Y148_9ROSI